MTKKEISVAADKESVEIFLVGLETVLSCKLGHLQGTSLCVKDKSIRAFVLSWPHPTHEPLYPQQGKDPFEPSGASVRLIRNWWPS